MKPSRRSDIDVLRHGIQQFVRRFGLLDEERTPCGVPINPRDAHALMIVSDREHRGDPPCQNDLALELGIDKSNVTRLLQRLQKWHCVDQVPSKQDGRTRILRLTPSGRRLAATIEEASRERFVELFAGVSPAKRKTIAAALALLNKVLGENSTEVELDAHA